MGSSSDGSWLDQGLVLLCLEDGGWELCWEKREHAIYLDERDIVYIVWSISGHGVWFRVATVRVLYRKRAPIEIAIVMTLQSYHFQVS